MMFMNTSIITTPIAQFICMITMALGPATDYTLRCFRTEDLFKVFS